MLAQPMIAKATATDQPLRTAVGQRSCTQRARLCVHSAATIKVSPSGCGARGIFSPNWMVNQAAVPSPWKSLQLPLRRPGHAAQRPAL